jgi:hypothetical protein
MNRLLQIRHPFVEQVLAHDDSFTVTVSAHVPIRPFRVWRAPELWPGYIEVDSEVGIKDLDGEVTWVHGTGTSADEAVEDLLIQLLNLVVDPKLLRDSDVVYRETTPPNKSQERTRGR